MPIKQKHISLLLFHSAIIIGADNTSLRTPDTLQNLAIKQLLTVWQSENVSDEQIDIFLALPIKELVMEPRIKEISAQAKHPLVERKRTRRLSDKMSKKIITLPLIDALQPCQKVVKVTDAEKEKLLLYVHKKFYSPHTASFEHGYYALNTSDNTYETIDALSPEREAVLPAAEYQPTDQTFSFPIAQKCVGIGTTYDNTIAIKAFLQTSVADRYLVTLEVYKTDNRQFLGYLRSTCERSAPFDPRNLNNFITRDNQLYIPNEDGTKTTLEQFDLTPYVDLAQSKISGYQQMKTMHEEITTELASDH